MVKKIEIRMPDSANIIGWELDGKRKTIGANIVDLTRTVNPRMVASVIGRFRYVVVEVFNCFLVISLEKNIGAPMDFIKKVRIAIYMRLIDLGSLFKPSKRSIKETEDD